MNKFFITFAIFHFSFSIVAFGQDPVFAEKQEIELFSGFSNNRFYNPNFADVDKDGDIDIVFGKRKPTLFLNISDDLNPYYQRMDTVLNFINSNDIESVRLQDYNNDKLADLTFINHNYNDWSTYVIGYENTSLQNQVSWSTNPDTLFSISIDSLLFDYVLIEDEYGINNYVIQILDDNIIGSDNRILKFHKIIDDSLKEIPGYFNGAPILSSVRLEPIYNQSGNLQYLIFNNYQYYEPIGGRSIFIAKNSGSTENPIWQYTYQYNVSGEIRMFSNKLNNNNPAIFQLLGSCEIIQGTDGCFTPVFIQHMTKVKLDSTSQNLRSSNLWMPGIYSKFTGLLQFDWKKNDIADILVVCRGEQLTGGPVSYYELFQLLADINNDLQDNATQFENDFPFGYFHSNLSFFSGGDLDNDGDYDIVKNNFYYSNNYVTAFINTGNDTLPIWNLQKQIPINQDGIEYTSLVDWDNDGDLDLAVSSNDSISIFENISSPDTFEFSHMPIKLNNVFGNHSVFFDFDQDNDLDIIAGNRYFKNETTEQAIYFVELDNILPEYPSNSALALINISSGKPDLLVIDVSGKMYFIQNNTVLNISEKTNSKLFSFSLSQNYPNPFNGTTLIQFSLERKHHVKLKLFNTLGQEVTVLIDEELQSGNYSKIFRPDELPSGVYFYSLQTENEYLTRLMNYIK